MNLPIDLIVANVMHEAAGQIAKVDTITTAILKMVPNAKVEKDTHLAQIHEAIARKLLCRISHDAPLPRVLAALTVLIGGTICVGGVVTNQEPALIGVTAIASIIGWNIGFIQGWRA